MRTAAATADLPTVPRTLEAARRELERLRAHAVSGASRHAIAEARAGQLEEFLARAVPVREPRGVAVGSKVTLRDLDSGAVVTYELTPPHSRLSPWAVSAISPLGSALVGRRAGQLVVADTPTGKTRRLRILVIRTDRESPA